ncbi:alpha/beta hydrolase (plasmid) [Halorussus limi]|uniref:Alpha/beta hydrolase n=1 Tax=Halorussus limi TaxID=2938695 RepID=A0A8U0HZ95_9EURY|nr:alpha/beta hydrolase [Halorussus limi]UPV76482.1 alpha/beta hydrolase [Halorussus limi]
MKPERAEGATGAPSSDDRESTEGRSEAVSPDSAVRTVTVGDGRRVAYAEYGATDAATDATPVAFLHGTPGSHVLGELYDEAARRRGVRLLAIERPGYGDSTPRPDPSPTDTDYLRAVLDDAGVSRVGVVAFSGGAAHALAFAATCGERVTEIDLVSGATPPSLRDETPVTIRLLGALAAKTPRLLTGLLGVQTWLAKRGPPSVVVGQYTADADEIPDEAAEIVREDFVRALDSHREGMVSESEQAVREWEFALTDVETPVRLWHGDRDENVPVAGARRLAETLPTAGVTVFEGEDHLSTLLRSRSRILDRHAGVDSDE